MYLYRLSYLFLHLLWLHNPHLALLALLASQTTCFRFRLSSLWPLKDIYGFFVCELKGLIEMTVVNSGEHRRFITEQQCYAILSKQYMLMNHITDKQEVDLYFTVQIIGKGLKQLRQCCMNILISSWCNLWVVICLNTDKQAMWNRLITIKNRWSPYNKTNNMVCKILFWNRTM